MVREGVVILNLFQDPVGLGALSREVLKQVQDDEVAVQDDG
jgi:hypothetical protein